VPIRELIAELVAAVGYRGGEDRRFVVSTQPLQIGHGQTLARQCGGPARLAPVSNR